jgi:hypothetical protein
MIICIHNINMDVNGDINSFFTNISLWRTNNLTFSKNFLFFE